MLRIDNSICTLCLYKPLLTPFITFKAIKSKRKRVLGKGALLLFVYFSAFSYLFIAFQKPE